MTLLRFIALPSTSRPSAPRLAWRPAATATLAAALTCIVCVGAGSAATAATTSDADPSAAAAGRPAASILLDDEWGDDDTNEDEKASRGTGRWEADKDWGSLYNVTKLYGAHDVWGKSDPRGQKVTGKGIDVAVIDTGVTPVRGLDGPGKIVNGPDLSFDSQSATTRYLDAYGHGTHMAGIIAGRDRDVPVGGEADVKRYVGVAPDARIVNVKVGSSDGGSDVTQIIAAIDWVTQNRRSNGMNIRVLNLSYGTASTNPYTSDPLARAVENAWKAGIVVVVAAGNDGAAAAQLTMPAADPYVIAVGASDHRGTDKHEDDRLTDFTNTGTSLRRPDFLSPGKSLVALRVPGSYADVMHPEGLVTGDTAGRFFRGSGTSQAAAVVSGGVALLLQARPTMTPDQVKKLLRNAAERLPNETDPARGAGQLDLKRALELSTPSLTSSRQSFPYSTGTGSLEASRGGVHVVDPLNGRPLVGNVDALGTSWDGARWSTASGNGTAWTGGTWNGARWSGDGWTGTSWNGARWSGVAWSGISWLDHGWSSVTWSGARWSGDAWSGARWSGARWSGRAF